VYIFSKKWIKGDKNWFAVLMFVWMEMTGYDGSCQKGENMEMPIQLLEDERIAVRHGSTAKLIRTVR
jgi:hypothetical protein